MTDFWQTVKNVPNYSVFYFCDRRYIFAKLLENPKLLPKRMALAFTQADRSQKHKKDSQVKQLFCTYAILLLFIIKNFYSTKYSFTIDTKIKRTAVTYQMQKKPLRKRTIDEVLIVVKI